MISIVLFLSQIFRDQTAGKPIFIKKNELTKKNKEYLFVQRKPSLTPLTPAINPFFCIISRPVGSESLEAQAG